MFRPNLSLEIFYDTELNSAEEGPNRGLLRDYESSDGPSFEALVESRSKLKEVDHRVVFVNLSSVSGRA